MANSLTAESCRTALRDVIDPEIYQNIVDLGLVYDVEARPDGDVIVTMTLTTPHCPMGPQILENVDRVLKRAGARSVTVNIVWEPMWTPYAMSDDLKRQLGIVEDEEPEPEPVWEPPPLPPKKKTGLLGKLFG